ncbi:MAG: bacillithiol system redox-active protein YtxJ [Planctomycetota bacterium]
MIPIDEQAALDAAFAAPRFLLFKHSGRCGISTHALRQVETFVAGTDTPAAVVDVLANRALSDEVAARTGIPHESPQVLLLENGQAIWSASHFEIAVASLREAVES